MHIIIRITVMILSFQTDRFGPSVDPNQMAPSAVSSESTLFDIQPTPF